MIQVNYTFAAGDICALMTEQLQATPAVQSIFTDSAHFQSLTHRETPSLISLISLHLLFTLHRSVTQTSPLVRHQPCILHLMIPHLLITLLNRVFTPGAEGRLTL